MNGATYLDKLISIILIVILLFVAPLIHQFKSLDTVMYNNAYNETKAFVDRCTTQGQITKGLVEDYTNAMAKIGNYKVKIEHQQRTFVPDPLDPAGYQAVYISYFNREILDESIYNNSLPMNERPYGMYVQDYLVVTATRTSKTYYEALKASMIGNPVSIGTQIRIGGMVRNEHH